MSNHKIDYELDCLEHIAPKEILKQYVDCIIIDSMYSGEIIYKLETVNWNDIDTLVDLIFKIKE